MISVTFYLIISSSVASGKGGLSNKKEMKFFSCKVLGLEGIEIQNNKFDSIDKEPDFPCRLIC